ncbi:MAG: hypothetical protein NC417_09650 [Candidatus Gastranaerophilales bacterium]|nr:hypothetical protein [Candidatus Gastranaerophilales bacterium]
MGKKKGNTAFWTGCIFAAFAAAAAVFVLLLQIEKNMLADYEKAYIYVAAREIPAGCVLTADNYGEYLEWREVDVNCIPETALTEEVKAENKEALFTIEQGVLLTEGMFADRNMVTQNMREPVIASLKAEDLCQVVGGVLRSGDYVHIYAVGEDGQAHLVWSDVFVEQVFDNAGNTISVEDHVTSAQRLNVYLDRNDVEAFYSQLAGGSLRVVKACDRGGTT